MKKMLILCMSLLFVLVLTACNQNTADPENNDVEPQNVGFNSENNDQTNPNQGQNDDQFRVPVDPGREQNIFEGDRGQGSLQWNRQNNPDGDQNGDMNRNGNTNNNQNRNQNNNQNAGGNNQADSNQGNNQQTPNAGGDVGQFQEEVVRLTNQERKNNGASELKIDQELMGVAQMKSEDMAENNYFSHTSPTYGSPFDMLRSNGIDYSKASENIAAGQQSAKDVVDSWMNSKGHRRNLLDPEVTHIGVGYTSNGDYWTQLFIKK
ncbi:hypothetical protein J416_15192 [Gracilibacillus halophilus YIM-C55.5]|uniref:SCP domain-containing protein n=1 Tax=Gracilibacillus halophilus YIM-C55.5 TaxID=1308866 RepID=N4WM87_9BACI|nr:CAP domain-containing protein [Gracilibacillus halophilus]ENH95610.1 hypothetical protein J416_15192 [Gracilibacillus halophilus YIM-C55.5]